MTHHPQHATVHNFFESDFNKRVHRHILTTFPQETYFNFNYLSSNSLLGELVKKKIPIPQNDTTNQTKPKNCNLIEKIYREITRYQNGKIVIRMEIGLYDICFHFEMKGYSYSFDHYVPTFYSCLSVRNLTKDIGEETRHLADPLMSPIDACLDGKI